LKEVGQWTKKAEEEAVEWGDWENQDLAGNGGLQ
jgi:hypothetical protein